jgi:SAM-dependent MidA family methyltransferase
VGVEGAKAPLGYKNVSSVAGKTLEVNPKCASFIRKIFELHATGSYSLFDFGQRNERAGMANGNGKAMNTSQLDRFLDNPSIAA